MIDKVAVKQLSEKVAVDKQDDKKQKWYRLSLSLPQPLLKGFFWGLTFGCTTMVSAGVGIYIALFTPAFNLIKPFVDLPNLDSNGLKTQINLDKDFQYTLRRPVNILVMGIDRVSDSELEESDDENDIFSGRSDTIMLMRFDPEDNSVTMLSIPRDTRVDNLGLSIPKINQANIDGGPVLAAQIISQTLNDVPIDRYIRVTTNTFRELVDLVGGVEVYVPEKMYYEDVTQKLKIDLEPGWQTLNGEQAEQFARFRNANRGDIARVKRQQILMKGLQKRLQNPLLITRIPQALKILEQYIDTNLTWEEIASLVKFSLQSDRDNWKMVMLPGRFSQVDEYQLSYWLLDTQGRDRIMENYFDREIETTTLVSNSWELQRQKRRLRIAIQNSTRTSDVGDRLVAYLRNNGFRRVYISENYFRPLEETEIVVQTGNIQGAEIIQEALGLGRIEASSTGDLDSDLTIRIGQDWLREQL